MGDAISSIDNKVDEHNKDLSTRIDNIEKKFDEMMGLQKRLLQSIAETKSKVVPLSLEPIEE